MDDTLDRVRECIRTAPRDPLGNTRAPAPTATYAGIAADEQALGFALPPLLKRLYLKVGNGGWGPGYGLLGLTGGAKDDLGETAARSVEELTRHAADDFRQCAGSEQEQRATLCRYLRRGADEDFTTGELVDFLGVSSPSVLDMAGYSEEAVGRVMKMLADITDEEKDDAIAVPSSALSAKRQRVRQLNHEHC